MAASLVRSDPPRGAPSGVMAQAVARAVQAEAVAASQVWAAWAAAFVGITALLATRALAPGLAGVWVGTDRLVAWVELGAAVLAQSFAIMGLASVLGLTVLLARGSRPVGVRALGVGVAGLVAMAMASAMFVVLPEMSGLVAGAAAAAFALAVAVHSGADREARWLALVLGACAAAGAVRMVSWALLDWLRVEAASPHPYLSILPEVGAVGAVLLDLVALVVGLGWLLGARPRAGRVALALATFALATAWTWTAEHGPGAEAVGLTVWLERALHRLVVGPVPAVPAVARAMVEAMSLILAVAALARPASTRLGATIVALALVSRTALEAPSSALALLLAAMLLVVGRGSGDLPPQDRSEPRGVG